VLHNTHPDIITLSRQIDEETGDTKKNISIEQVREIQSRLHTKPLLDGYQFVYITEAEHISIEAANALLKILEEPGEQTIFILLTTSLARIPATVVSRCQMVQLRPVATETIAKFLRQQKLPRAKADTIARLANGRPGVAQEYLNNSQQYEEYVSSARELLALHRMPMVEQFQALAALGEISREQASQRLDQWQVLVRDIALLRHGCPELTVHQNLETELQAIAQHMTDHDVVALFQALQAGHRYLQANVNPRLLFENILITLPASASVRAA
jgi:DNA polymerase-3 subunit delta'